MQVKQLLNRLQKFKSFVYEHVRFVDTPETLAIEAAIRPRAHSLALLFGVYASWSRL